MTTTNNCYPLDSQKEPGIIYPVSRDLRHPGYPYKSDNILLALSVSYVYYQHVQLDFKGKGEDMLFRVSWSPNQTMSNLSPLGYHAFDIYNYYENKQTKKLTSEENQEIKSWFAQKQENQPVNSYNSIFKGQNLIVIQVGYWLFY